MLLPKACKQKSIPRSALAPADERRSLCADAGEGGAGNKFRLEKSLRQTRGALKLGGQDGSE
eukprot:2430459-Alexandrium_andersonii.AAC.1